MRHYSLRVCSGFKPATKATNSLQEVWGDDANVWNPSRFLSGDRDKQAGIGVFANL